MILEKQGDREVYSDTKELEQEMLDIARKYPEDLSQDYIAKDHRYTVNNTFSSVRRNLLNWYHFRENAVVLEVGAGMGALTGCLCDRCRQVTALEMSEKRAEVIRNRYPNRTNLEIVCEDLFSWNTEQKYDYVVVVGVLEYAAIFGKQYKNPFLEFVRRLKSFLKNDGIVLLAIENKFGLKYWCGAAEDHLCQPFLGIEGYVQDHTAVTFSKARLKELFTNSGYGKIKFYYVLPDYKFPTVIYTDEYPPGASAVQKTAFQYVKGSRLIYDEKKLYQELIENQVEGFFANSFLVEATAGDRLPEQPVYIAAKSESRKEYRVSTLIYADGKVVKTAMHEKAADHMKCIKQYEEQLMHRGINVLKSEWKEGNIILPFYSGLIAEDYFHQKLLENDMQGIQLLVDVLESNIKKSSDFVSDKNKLWEICNYRKDYGLVLKHGFIDMTFSNCFWENGELVFFDQEWCFDDIPLKFILFFAVRQSFLSFTGKSKITLDELYRKLQIDESCVKDFIALERYLWELLLYRQEHLYDGDGWYQDYSEKISLIPQLQQYDKLEKKVEEKNEYLLQLEKELKDKNSHILNIEQNTEQKNQYILYVEQEIEQKNQYLLHLEKELARKNEYIQTLEKTLTQQEQLVRKEQGKLLYKISRRMKGKKDRLDEHG